MKQLQTSLNEIKSFQPCSFGWKDILIGQSKTKADDVLFLLADTVQSNSISDVCWLIGKRKVEIQILVRFAKMCADDVEKYKTSAAAYAAYAATAATTTAYYATTTATADYAATAATTTAYYATNAAGYATTTTAREKQVGRNKQFLIQCINEYGSTR